MECGNSRARNRAGRNRTVRSSEKKSGLGAGQPHLSQRLGGDDPTPELLQRHSLVGEQSGPVLEAQRGEKLSQVAVLGVVTHEV